MKFIKDMMSRKSKAAPQEPASVDAFEDVIGIDDFDAPSAPKPVSEAPMKLPQSARIQVKDTSAGAASNVADEADDILQKLTSRLDKDTPNGAVNIWDIEDENDTVEATMPVAQPSRRRRNKTRLLGFNEGDGDVVSMFDTAPKQSSAQRTQFPVGWMLVEDGPGRGECFTLEAGMSQIGRGDDQAIQLDFGDNSISRTNHAAIVYDTETHEFSLGHGGKKNIVRLNGKPVISNETLALGDKIKIGETTLHFVPLCSDTFNWSDDGDDTEETENVAIA